MSSVALSRAGARRAVVPIMSLFFMAGAAFAAWGVQIPLIKARLGASDAQISLAMLCVAGGAVLAMKQVGRWVARVGSGPAIVASGLLFALALLAIPQAGSFFTLLPVLLVFGMAMAGFDVAVNVQAANVEVQLEKPIMSTLHGMFSVGGMAGAALGSVNLALGWHAALFASLIGVVLALMALAAKRRLLADAPAEAQAEVHAGRGARAVWVIGVVAFLGLVCEGAMYDWAAVYMRDVVGAGLDVSAYGYAAFSTGMAISRFGADLLRRRLRVSSLLSVSAWIGLGGIVLTIALPYTVFSLLGFFMMGLGLANFMPLFFLAGTRIPGLSPAAGVAIVGRFAYAGMLFGPALIGGVSHLGDLRIGMVAVALVMAAIALVGIAQVCRQVSLDH
ncbi:MFS transporter [Pseudomonas putida]|uniref:MFS transporter n=1 Tax=Pseudomonas putida TaxID=303 RepID=UPI003839E0C1